MGAKYLSWMDNDFDLFIDSKKVRPSKIEEKVGETLKLTRERSSGQNIHYAAKITVTKQKDGTLMKKVTKQTYANVTVREKRKHEDSTEISQEGYRKRAKMVSNILDHTSIETNKLTPQQTSSLMTGTRKDVILCVETNQDCI